MTINKNIQMCHRRLGKEEGLEGDARGGTLFHHFDCNDIAKEKKIVEFTKKYFLVRP
jgi:hypothetical protein